MAVMTGTNGRDFLRGTSNSDDITGRWGGDWLYGGNGYDKFIYTSIYDSPTFGPKGYFPWNYTSYDVILDFNQGDDKIDLTGR
jgi:serralysin